MDGEVAPKPDEPVKKSKIVEILNRFLRWRPSKEELQDRNIIKGNTDTIKSTLERNQTRKKLATLFGQYQKAGSKDKCRYPQFGIDPAELARLYPDQPNGIPRLLSHCFAYLEKNLLFEGLFRVTGSHVQITSLRQQIENGNYEVIDSCLAPQSITGMVSLFFRQLPHPLMPCELFDDFMEAASVPPSDKVEAIKLLLERLPEANFKIMITFLALLKKIALNSAHNMMNASNLSLVWGPTLLQPSDPMQSMVNNNLTKSCSLVEIMISQYELVFATPPMSFSTPSPAITIIGTSSLSSSGSLPNSSYNGLSNTPSPNNTPNNTPLSTSHSPPNSQSTSPKRNGSSPPSSELPTLSPRPPGTPLPVPPVVTPTRPPVAHRRTPAPFAPISATPPTSGTTPNSKPPPPKQSSVTQSPHPPVQSPPASMASPPSASITSPPSQTVSFNIPTISSPGSVRPPRPPRYNTVTNLHLSPKVEAPSFTKADSSPDLTITAASSKSDGASLKPPIPPTRRYSPGAPVAPKAVTKPPARPPPAPPLPMNRGKRTGT